MIDRSGQRGEQRPLPLLHPVALVALGGSFVWTTVDDGQPLPTDTSATVDWLSMCRLGVDCALEITVNAGLDRTMFDDGLSSPPAVLLNGEIDWAIETRLDAFDGRPLSPEGFRFRDL